MSSRSVFIRIDSRSLELFQRATHGAVKTGLM